jgi:hypothetical protein
MKTLKTLTFITLILTLGVALTAWADRGDAASAPLFKTPLNGQPSFQAKPLLQLAQGMTQQDVCLAKCEEALTSCQESGTAEAECNKALEACQNACESED